MHAIEPNWGALLAFVPLWAAACLGFLVLAGMYPVGRRPAAARGKGALALIAIDSVLWLALAAAVLGFGAAHLRLTTLIVAGGLVLLFAPAPFELLPPAWRDGRRGLAALAALQAGALAATLAAGAHLAGRLA